MMKITPVATLLMRNTCAVLRNRVSISSSKVMLTSAAAAVVAVGSAGSDSEAMSIFEKAYDPSIMNQVVKTNGNVSAGTPHVAKTLAMANMTTVETAAPTTMNSQMSAVSASMNVGTAAPTRMPLNP